MYVEVLEVEDLYTSPVPTKIMGSSLRHTKSEENLTGGEPTNPLDKSGAQITESQNVNNPIRQTPVRNVNALASRCIDNAFNYTDDDPADCWSQEDDEITQQVKKLHFRTD